MSALIILASYIGVSHPSTYKLTSGLLGHWVATADGLPKTGGLILHGVVFMLLAGLLLMLLLGRRASGFSFFVSKSKALRKI
jgi:hypothetical protein